jgi:hypothetical protein
MARRTLIFLLVLGALLLGAVYSPWRYDFIAPNTLQVSTDAIG